MNSLHQLASDAFKLKMPMPGRVSTAALQHPTYELMSDSVAFGTDPRFDSIDIFDLR